jgi:fumarylacetoacetase
MGRTNDFLIKSWINVPSGHDFPLQNLPFGVFTSEGKSARNGSRIGDFVIDLVVLHESGYFSELNLPVGIFAHDTLNTFIQLKRPVWKAVRARIFELFSEGTNELKDDESDKNDAVIALADCNMLLPVQIGDYTDFYSSKEHATNVGTMFRDPANALLPNWLHIPVGYHGRSSSIVESGVAVHRPMGQTRPDENEPPIFGPSKLVDFELEMAFITTEGKPLGQRISTEEAEDYIFGLVVFNDWSARDMQKWEYVPLGPFLAKNFASCISPWIVTMDALEPFRCEGPDQSEPKVLPYLEFNGNKSFDIHLQAAIHPEGSIETIVSNSNFKYMYWSMVQQLAHHTVNGCNIKAGDMMGSGTISGPTAESYGSMLEIAWKGTKPFKMNDGSERRFIQDNDTVIMRGYCEKGNDRIGFGEVSTKLLPIVEF